MKTNNLNDSKSKNQSVNNAKPNLAQAQTDKTSVENKLKTNDANGAACPVDNAMKGVNYMPPKDENTL